MKADWRIPAVTTVSLSAAIAFASVVEPLSNRPLPSDVEERGHRTDGRFNWEPSEPLFPESLRRFDMICQTEGPTFDDRRGQQSGSDFVPTDSWRSEFRESVDLNLGQSCTTPCDNGPRNVVAPPDAERIVWSETPGYSRWVRRSDGQYLRRVSTEEGVEEETGYCRPWAFTELSAAYVTTLPPKPGAEKLGLVIDYSLHRGIVEHSADAPAFPVGARRFDIFCAVRSVEGESPWWPIDEAPGVVDDFWIGDLRLTIDLDAARSCLVGCNGGPMDRAITADAERITFRGQPGITSWLDRITGYYRTRRETYGRVEESRGYCQPQPFTEAVVKDANSRRQDVGPVIAAARMIADEAPGMDFRHAAFVPESELNRAFAEGWYHDAKAWKRWANDPANACYRTWKGGSSLRRPQIRVRGGAAPHI